MVSLPLESSAVSARTNGEVGESNIIFSTERLFDLVLVA